MNDPVAAGCRTALAGMALAATIAAGAVAGVLVETGPGPIQIPAPSATAAQEPPPAPATPPTATPPADGTAVPLPGVPTARPAPRLMLPSPFDADTFDLDGLPFVSGVVLPELVPAALPAVRFRGGLDPWYQQRTGGGGFLSGGGFLRPVDLGPIEIFPPYRTGRVGPSGSRAAAGLERADGWAGADAFTPNPPCPPGSRSLADGDDGDRPSSGMPWLFAQLHLAVRAVVDFFSAVSTPARALC